MGNVATILCRTSFRSCWLKQQLTPLIACGCPTKVPTQKATGWRGSMWWHQTAICAGGCPKVLAKKGSFHFCEENSQDCQETRKGKGKAMHLENFREITQKEVDNQVPGWAFEGSPKKIFEAYLKRATLTAQPTEKGSGLPWQKQQKKKNKKKAKVRARASPAREKAVKKKRKTSTRKEQSPAEGREGSKKKKRKRSPRAVEESDRERKRQRRRVVKASSSGDSSSAVESEDPLFGEEGPGRSCW